MGRAWRTASCGSARGGECAGQEDVGVVGQLDVEPLRP